MSFELSNLINECAASYAGGTECLNCVNGKNCDTCKCYDSCIRPLHQYNSNGKHTIALTWLIAMWLSISIVLHQR